MKPAVAEQAPEPAEFSASGDTQARLEAATARDRAALVRDIAADARDDSAAAADDRAGAARDRLAARADRQVMAEQLADAAIDGLTKARTRTGGLVALDGEVARARRAGGRLVLAYVDVVGLKALNDARGHSAGDELLGRVVTLIRGHLRSYDLIIRLGGDEFLCAMSDATMPDARRRFRAIADALRATPGGGEITTGFAELAPGASATDMIALADAEMLASRVVDPRATGRRADPSPTREAVVARTLLELSDTLVADLDLRDLLTTLTHRCVELIELSGAVVVLAAPTGRLHAVAASSHALRLQVRAEAQFDEGPARDCYETGEPVACPDLSGVAARWPTVGPRAAAAGFRSSHTVPLRLRNHTIGALSLLRAEIGQLHPNDTTVAQAFADAATIGILRHRAAVAAEGRNAQLQGALDSRVIIEQAKGVVGQSLGENMEQAFSRLRNHARANHLPLAEVAESIVVRALHPAALDDHDASRRDRRAAPRSR